MKLLIVDDHAPTRALIREFVQPLSTEIRECSNGAEAVALYPSFQPRFVIMDLMMPELNGFAAAERICALDASAAVILISHAGSAVAETKALSAGACRFFPKDDLAGLRDFLAASRS